MNILDLNYEELTNVLFKYIREKYDFDSVDIYDDVITFYYENGKKLNVYVSIEDCEED